MNLARAFGLTTDLAIDLGTANTCVYAPGRGIVLNEPSVVAFNTTSSRVEAVGTAAKEMLGRTPGHMVAIKPLRDGVIADFEAAEKMPCAAAPTRWKAHGLLIGERTAEAIKIALGSATPLDVRQTMEVKGRHLADGVPRTVVVNDGEVRDALSDTVNVLVRAVRDVLERVPPELSADICERGIVLTGGGSLLKHLDRRLRADTLLPVAVAEDPLASVVLGAGKMLDDLSLLRRIAA